MTGGKFRFAIDRGGTFTDVYAQCPSGKTRVMKLLSVDPANYRDAPTEGIRRIMEMESGKPLPAYKKIDGSLIEWIRMGTTVATNALLERKGERMALLINRGFKDLLYIGNQARPKIFDLEIVTPEVLYEEVVEVDCRVVPEMASWCKMDHDGWPVVEGVTGERFYVTCPLDTAQLACQLRQLRATGIKSIAIVLMHSYTYIEDELLVGEVAHSVGFEHVSLSHQVMPMVRIVGRGFTACADAYLTPHIKQYIQGFASSFKNDLKGVNVLFMQSDGGLTPMDVFNGSRAVLSGPAGGVVGYATTSPRDIPVIGFDMGGTSTDVSRYDGAYEHVFESTTAGITIQAPQLDVNTVAAGGGSCLFFRSGLFVVGPESAGAHPGPVCYRKGGPLTVTDANLVLGRLIPEYFPHIFGPDENQPLDREAAVSALQQLTDEINQFLTSQTEDGDGKMSVEEVAMGFIKVANEAMCRPIRALTQAKGYDTRRHRLACFGGAGAQHACAIARSLGMSSVVIHKYAGILSAYGMACADVVHEAQEPCAKTYDTENLAYLDERLRVLTKACVRRLYAEGFTDDQIETTPYLHLRYNRTDGALMCPPAEKPASPPTLTTEHGDFLHTFLQRYESEFGFTIPNRTILVDDIRVRGVGKSLAGEEFEIEKADGPPQADQVTEVYFEGAGRLPTAVYLLAILRGGHLVPGPAVIMDQLCTVLVEPGCRALVTATGDISIDVGSSDGGLPGVGTDLEAVQLSIFSHRFMSIAEQMGRTLQRTSISTNIKERLDFSCALFGPDGGLVSNAPHIPVHLGAMQETVQYQMKVIGDSFRDGDVILSNHPKAGGSHLPDLTVITPVFYKDVKSPVFFVASRGHHADIGGIMPGSMPPHSKTLAEEGVSFKTFYLLKEGRFCEEELIEAFKESRNLADNISDLKAQVAANQKGITLVRELIDSYGLAVVQAYMGHIQANAELAVRDMLREIGSATTAATGANVLRAVDYLDDGSPICLTVTINVEDGSALCDFSGSGYEVWGNCNAPRAITLSALIYCLRCMVGHDVPLNQGCLKPVRTVIPAGSLLDPSENAAVVGGNVQTSQRIVDVVFRAFGTCAASQGCMNNVTFGQQGWGYYETVAGGAGAGPRWDGRSGVHSHMTNTRITDPEILECRYPVILRTFTLRPDSGGRGAYKGGDGVIRELQFRAPIALSVLTERRVFAPYGLHGGAPGEKGSNLMFRSDGRIINLGAKTAIDVGPGDIFQLLTPGGGGWGKEEEAKTVRVDGKKKVSFMERGSLYEFKKAQESV